MPSPMQHMAIAVHVLECEKAELIAALRDALDVIRRARQFKGYGIGPLEEPNTERVERHIGLVIAKHEKAHGLSPERGISNA